jgi:hypothetical protein
MPFCFVLFLYGVKFSDWGPDRFRFVSAVNSARPKNSSHDDSPLFRESDSCALEFGSGGGSNELNDDSFFELCRSFALLLVLEFGSDNKDELLELPRFLERFMAVRFWLPLLFPSACFSFLRDVLAGVDRAEMASSVEPPVIALPPFLFPFSFDMDVRFSSSSL